MNKKVILLCLIFLIPLFTLNVNASAQKAETNQASENTDEEPNLIVLFAVIGIVTAIASYRVHKYKSDKENEEENQYNDFKDSDDN